MEGKEYMTQEELSKFLGITGATISYWHKHNLIPKAKRIKNKLLYSKKDALEIAKIRGFTIPSMKK